MCGHRDIKAVQLKSFIFCNYWRKKFNNTVCVEDPATHNMKCRLNTHDDKNNI